MNRRLDHKHLIPPALVGVGVIVAMLCAFWLAATKQLPWVNQHELKLQFSSANHLRPNSPVRIAGVNVGVVEKVERGPGVSATVTASIDGDALPVHSDATAEIRPRTFLEGNFFVDLHPGSPSTDELGDGGVVPVGQTRVPVQFDQVLTTFQPRPREQLRRTLNELGTALDGDGPRALNATFPVLPPLLRDAAAVSEALGGTQPHDLSRAIAATSRVTETLAEHRPELGSLVSSFAAVARALSDDQRALAGSITGLETVLEDAPPSLAALERAVPETRELVAELRPALREAGPVIAAAEPTVDQVQGLLGPAELPKLVGVAEPTVSSLASFLPDGTTTAAALRGPTSCLLNSAIPTLKTAIDDGPLSSGEPVYREIFYSNVGLSSASQNFDGNGFATRYYAGFGDDLVATPFGGASQLFGWLPDPPLGSRPRKPAQPPPLEPTEPCTESDPIDLSAQTGPGGFASLAAPPAKDGG